MQKLIEYTVFQRSKGEKYGVANFYTERSIPKNVEMVDIYVISIIYMDKTGSIHNTFLNDELLETIDSDYSYKSQPLMIINSKERLAEITNLLDSRLILDKLK